MSVEDETRGYRLLHTMLRVRDPDRAIDFYTRLLGMRLLRQFEVPKHARTLTFLGYGDESSQAVIELEHETNRTAPYELGDGYGYVAVGVPDVLAACDRLRNEGIELLQEPDIARKGGAKIALIKDPEGYVVELIERA